MLFRLLCKLPGTEEDPNSREVPWHQDSQYWPLEPMKVGRTFSASCKITGLMSLPNLSILINNQQEATLWLALDDVTAENGAMDMFTFNAVPEVVCLSVFWIVPDSFFVTFTL